VLNSEYTAQTVSELRLIITDDWVPLRGLRRKSQESTQLSGRLIEVFLSVAAENSIDVPLEVADRLRDILGVHLAGSAALYRAFLKRCRQLAGERMLVAALGNPANRALAVAARRQGVNVVAFLHGNTVFSQYEHNRVNLDVALSDEYVVYTESSIPRLQEIARKYPPIRGNMPGIVSAEASIFRNIWEQKKNLPLPDRIRRVMIVEIGVQRDVAPRFKPSDLVNADLTIRVAKLLRRHGYDVLLKRHPNPLKRSWAPDPFSPYMDIRYERFEDVMDDTDAYLITYPTSTIFHWAICSNKPIIYLDDGLFEWFEQPRALFERRARVVRVKADEQNRLMFSDDELLEALARPVTEPDISYAEQLLFSSKD
jgi:hypothetical protein